MFYFLAIGIIVEVNRYTYFHPGYKVLAMVPDKVLGRKYVANFEGLIPQDIGIQKNLVQLIKINSLGFFDFERKVEKGY